MASASVGVAAGEVAVGLQEMQLRQMLISQSEIVAQVASVDVSVYTEAKFISLN